MRNAYTYHLLVGTEAEAKRLQAEVEKVEPERRFEKFKAVARRASIDGTSKATGGDLGWVYEGEMVRPFEEAIFAATPHQLVSPFRTDFGWHLAYVTEVRELPVSGICRPPLIDAHRRAEGQWKVGIGLAMQPLNREDIADQVRAVIGIDWKGPMRDGEGALIFVRSRGGEDDEVRAVSQHIELREGVLYATARPMGCAYSERIEWSINCSDRSIAFLGSTSFEGRGAVGRILRNVFVAQPQVEHKPIVKGSFGEQLHGLACPASN